MVSLSYYFQFGTEVHFEPGQIITSSKEGGKVDDIFILADGICSLNSLSYEGNNKIYDYFTSERIIGIAPLLNANQNINFIWSSFSLQAKTHCLTYKISKETFNQLCKEPEFLRILTETIAENFIRILQVYKSHSDEPISIQFARFLLAYAKPNHRKQLSLDKFFKYQEIADYLGVHSVTIARLVKSLKEQEIVKKDGQQLVILQEDKLKEIISSQEPYSY